MKFTEFYENHTLIVMPDGTLHHPKLRKHEKAIIDKAEEFKVDPFVMTRGRGGNKIIVNPLIDKK